MHSTAYNIITSFPDFKAPDFDIETYNRQFRESNIVIRANSKQVAYEEHWGPLSIKCAFNGKEFYDVHTCRYAVTDKNYLVINNGNYYSSFIDSITQVNSFTINFTPLFVKEAMTSLSDSHESILDNFGNHAIQHPEFYEKLYRHDDTVSPILFRLLKQVDDFDRNLSKVEELFALLLERLLLKNEETQAEVNAITSVKSSTRSELYKRLIRAKDYIDSCYDTDITLDDLATLTCLNRFYFLRQFRDFFKVTPGQYIIQKRLEVAAQLLRDLPSPSVSAVCARVGYSDTSSFSKSFKQFYNCPPEKYAQLHNRRVK